MQLAHRKLLLQRVPALTEDKTNDNLCKTRYTSPGWYWPRGQANTGNLLTQYGLCNAHADNVAWSYTGLKQCILEQCYTYVAEDIWYNLKGLKSSHRQMRLFSPLSNNALFVRLCSINVFGKVFSPSQHVRCYRKQLQEQAYIRNVRSVLLCFVCCVLWLFAVLHDGVLCTVMYFVCRDVFCIPWCILCTVMYVVCRDICCVPWYMLCAVIYAVCRDLCCVSCSLLGACFP